MAAKYVSRNNSGRITFNESDDDGECYDTRNNSGPITFNQSGECDDNNEQCNDDSLDEVQPLIDAIFRLPESFQRQLLCVQHKKKISAENVLEEFKQKIEALNDGNKRTCAYCSTAKRVEDMRSLQKGQHISIPGEHLKFYSKLLDKQVSLYRHHAIVKRIVQSSREMAEVVLINFSKKNGEIKVRQQTQTYNLQYDELCIIEHQYPKYGPDEIIRRAESIVEQSEKEKRFKSYNLLTKNCEHFATWCVLGQEESVQAHTFSNDIKQMLWNIFGGGSKIARLILKLLANSSDEIVSCFTKAVNIPLVVLGGCCAGYIIYCIIKTVYLIKQYRNNKTICWYCLNQKLCDLWLQFGTYFLTSGITFGIVNFALPLLAPWITIPIATVLVLVATALTLAVPRIRKVLCSPNQYSEKEIKTLSEMKPGDVASLTYWSLRHLVLVSEVKCDIDPQKGTVRGIHYSLPAFFGTREIAEETFQVDLKRSKVNLVQFNSLFTFSPEEVVDRIRKRLGERRWNIFFNRSDHLCQWAKLKSRYNFEENECLEDEETGNTYFGNTSSLLVEKADVYLMNEIQPGDVVEYNSYKEIVVKLEDVKKGRVFRMQAVRYFNSRGTTDFYMIDLNKHHLVVHRYHPVHCVSRKRRVEKALSIIDKPIQYSTQTDFVKDIILKPK